MLALICSILPYTWPIMLKINYAGIFGWSLNLIAMSNLKLMMNVKAAIWILRNKLFLHTKCAIHQLAIPVFMYG